MSRQRATILVVVLALGALLGLLVTRGTPPAERSIGGPLASSHSNDAGSAHVALGEATSLQEIEAPATEGSTRQEGESSESRAASSSSRPRRSEQPTDAARDAARTAYAVVIEGEVRTSRWERVPRATVTYSIPVLRGGRATGEQTVATGVTDAAGRFEVTAPLRNASEQPGSPITIHVDSRNHAVLQQIVEHHWSRAREEMDGRFVYRLLARLEVRPVAAFVAGECPGAEEIYLTTVPGPEVPYPALVLDRGPAASFRLRAPAGGRYALVAVARERHPAFAYVEVEENSEPRGSPTRLRVSQDLTPLATRLDVTTAGPKGFDPAGLRVRIAAADLIGRPREADDGPGGWLGGPPFFAWNGSPAGPPSTGPWGWDLTSSDPRAVGDVAVTEFEATAPFGADGVAELRGAPNGAVTLWVESPFWRERFEETFVGNVVAVDRVVAQPPVARLDVVPAGPGVPRVAQGTARAACVAPPGQEPLARSARLDEKGIAALFVPSETEMRIELALDRGPDDAEGRPGPPPPPGVIDAFRSPRAGAAHSLTVHVPDAKPESSTSGN